MSCSTERLPPRNATDYDLIGETFFDAIRIGLDAVDEPYDVALKNTYWSRTLFNTTDDGIANDFLLYNEADDQWFNIGSDERRQLCSLCASGRDGSSSSLRSATGTTPRPCDNLDGRAILPGPVLN